MSHEKHQVLETPIDNYVLPSPPRGQAELLVADGASTAVGVASTAAVARAFGERLEVKAQCMGGFLTELRDRLERLDAAIAEDSRAQLKGAVRELGHVVDWCDAVRAELADEGAMARSGREPIDLGQFCEQLATRLQATTEPISVRTVGTVTVWCERGALAHLLERALAVVWARTGGVGLRCLGVAAPDGTPQLRVWSRGEPTGDVDAELVDALRNVATKVGARILPDELGPGGAGLLLAFGA
ncbi:MAG TPA: hypothetical protein ENI87_04905 [bacterium]|nr:hypothetical protein [bacterium]